MHLINNTPFETLAVPVVCQQDKNHLVVVVKASFDINSNNTALQISNKQQAIFLSDEFWGEPNLSSLRYETDMALLKPKADVVVIGAVYPEKGSARSVDAAISIGSSKKIVRAFGNRRWEKGVGGYQISPPEMFESMPLLFENAFGGSFVTPHSELSVSDERNPVGKGFIDTKSKPASEALSLPNLENPGHLISDIHDRPEPWSTGFVARTWQPRRAFTGTYNSDWERDRNPLMPVDFNDQAHNAASMGLITPYLNGGEPIELINMSQDGPLSFNLPLYNIGISSYIRNTRCQHEAKLDTIVIEPDERRLSLTWRCSFQIHWNLAMIEWVKISGQGVSN